MSQFKQIKYAWIYWGLPAFFVFYQFVLQVFPGACLLELSMYFHVSKIQVGQMSSLFYYAFAIGLIPTGFFIDQIGPRKCLALGEIICAIGCLIFAFSHIWLGACVGRLIMGLGSSSAFAGTLKLISIWFNIEKNGLMSGLTVAIAMLGAMFGQTLLVYLVHNSGLQIVIISMGLIGCVFGLLIYFTIKDSKLNNKGEFLSNLYDVIKNKDLWISALFAALIYLPLPVFAGIWAVPFFSYNYNINVSDASKVCSYAWLGMALGNPFFGFLIDRFFNKKIIMVFGILGGTVFFSIILYINWFSENSIKYVLFLLGFFCGSYSVAFSVIRELKIANSNGLSVSFAMAIVMILSAVTSQLIGYLLLITSNNYKSAFTTIPIFLLMGLAMLGSSGIKNRIMVLKQRIYV